ncbi:MAG: peptide chain release factor N(5)-glutamine methyltransferase [Gaiellaceae bacterium]
MTPRTVEAAASVRGWIPAAAERLAAAGCDTSRLDAELLVAGALGVDRARLLLEPEQPVPPEADALLGRREAREPVAYILGRRAFRHIELAVDPRVLIPRPETELLVEVALELPHGARVHDVGTGSGAVALAIKHERPDLAVSASDASPGAIAVARANAGALGLDVELRVVDGLPDGDRDLVVANLPYVRTDEMAGLAPEIARYEPRSALAAGSDGLDAIRSLVGHARSGTRLALEHAPAQDGAVRALLDGAETRADLAGLPRVTVGRAP